MTDVEMISKLLDIKDGDRGRLADLMGVTVATVGLWLAGNKLTPGVRFRVSEFLLRADVRVRQVENWINEKADSHSFELFHGTFQADVMRGVLKRPPIRRSISAHVKQKDHIRQFSTSLVNKFIDCEMCLRDEAIVFLVRRQSEGGTFYDQATLIHVGEQSPVKF